MPKNIMLEVKDGDVTGALRGFLKSLLEKGLLDALLTPVAVPSGKNVVQTLVEDPRQIDNAEPLAPVMPVNSAKIISSLTKTGAPGKKIGVVLRSCELRALRELVKLKQAELTNLVLIGVDCFGTYPVQDYAEAGVSTNAFLKNGPGDGDAKIRLACKVCRYPAPLNADLTIGLIGMDLGRELLIGAQTPEGERLLGAPGIEGNADAAKRDAAVAKLAAEREKQKGEFLLKTAAELGGLQSMLAALSSCVACHNCRVACPICYCRECLLDSPTFTQWEADKYLEWADRKGALRLPADSLLFHLVRLNHMGASCVACGLCGDACPNGVEVFKLFGLGGAKVQQLFEYLPGRSPEDELPLTAFKEKEFKNFEL
jgi:formate dehydrogenase (coenzyme F420) beta subunit